MKSNNESPKQVLNRAIDEIRHAEVRPQDLEQAASRVLQNMAAEFNKVVPHPAATDAAGRDRIQSCEDYQSLIPAYLSRSLTPSRRLLLEDHSRECTACRKALESARRGTDPKRERVEIRSRLRRAAPRRYARWIVPAAAAIVLVLALETTAVRDLIWPIDVHATVQTIEGGLYEVTGQSINALKVGGRIERHQVVRTSAASGAVLVLADGSKIEMAQQSELLLDRARDGVKVQLARGNVILQAAKQRDGHLYVETNDCIVSVVGTVFSINAGVKGSRVTVIEGEVHVEYGETEQSVLPGQQAVTNPEMGTVPIDQEIAWSRDAEALRKEIAAFGQDFANRVRDAAMRYSSDLIPLVPEDTFVLAALPNATLPFSESYALFRRRISENSSLESWWLQRDGSESRMRMDDLVRAVETAGSHLGPEIVLAFPKDIDRGFLLIARTSNAEAFLGSIAAAVAGIGPQVRLVRTDQELEALGGNARVFYAVNDLAAAGSAAAVRRAVLVHRGQAQSSFAATPLYQRLQQSYAEGVGWLAAADMQQVVPGEFGARPQMGLADMQQIVLEQKTGYGTTASLATVGFSQARRGVAAWLASPAPMGSLEFVSPDAYMVSAVLAKDPALILDDVLTFMAPDADFDGIEDLQRILGVDFRRDLAEPLGNEFLMAIDGPLLPKPSWKIVVEVRDAPRIENAVRWLVTNINREMEIRGTGDRPSLALTSETVEGRTFHALKVTGASVPEIHFTFWTGYMIIGPSRALLIEAIKNHDSGNTLARAGTLRAHLPAENRDHFSAIMYQNIQHALTSIGAGQAVEGVLGRELENLAFNGLPNVLCIYGEPDRMRASARGAYGINLAGMLALHGMMAGAGLH